MPVNCTFAALSKNGFGGANITPPSPIYYAALFPALYGNPSLTFNRTIGEFDESNGYVMTTGVDAIVGIDPYGSTPIVRAASNNAYADFVSAKNGVTLYKGVNDNIFTDASYSNDENTGTIGNTYTNSKEILDGDGYTLSIGLITGSPNQLGASKYNSSGIVWQYKWTLPDSVGIVTINDVDVDSSNNLYFGGVYQSSGASGPDGLWGKISNTGTMNWLWRESSFPVYSIKVVGSNFYIGAMTTAIFYKNYLLNSTSLFSAFANIGVGATSTGTLSQLSAVGTPGGPYNKLVVTGVDVNPADTSKVFLSGYIYDYVGGPHCTAFVYQMASNLLSGTRVVDLSFTVNTTVNPTWTNNQTFIDRVSYTPTTDVLYITGSTNDTDTGSLSGSDNYMNSFVIRSHLGTTYSASVADRTVNIFYSSGPLSIVTVSPLSPISIIGTQTSTAYSLSITTTTLSSGSTVLSEVTL